MLTQRVLRKSLQRIETAITSTSDTTEDISKKVDRIYDRIYDFLDFQDRWRCPFPCIMCNPGTQRAMSPTDLEHMHVATIFQEPETISPEEAKSAILQKFKKAAGFEEISGVDFIQDSETRDILDAIEYWLSKAEEGFQTPHTANKIYPANFLNLMKCGWLVRRIAKYKMPEETRRHIEQLRKVCAALFLSYLSPFT